MATETPEAYMSEAEAGSLLGAYPVPTATELALSGIDGTVRGPLPLPEHAEAIAELAEEYATAPRPDVVHWRQLMDFWRSI